MLGVFVVAAVLTPPDWVSQVFLAGPMVLLYLVGVAVAWLFGSRGKKEKAAEPSQVPTRTG